MSRLFVKVCRASSAIGDERGGALSRVEDEDLPQRHTGCALTNMILIHKIFKSLQFTFPDAIFVRVVCFCPRCAAGKDVSELMAIVEGE